MLIVKLSGLLRRLLKSQEHFVTFREELDAIDEYLDIETVRFGPRLRIDKTIDPATLDVVVPTMLLQPLVENSIKHGLSPKIGEGRITIRSLRQEGHTIIDIIDNGVGVAAAGGGVTAAGRVGGLGGGGEGRGPPPPAATGPTPRATAIFTFPPCRSAPTRHPQQRNLPQRDRVPPNDPPRTGTGRDCRRCLLRPSDLADRAAGRECGSHTVTSATWDEGAWPWHPSPRACCSPSRRSRPR